MDKKEKIETLKEKMKKDMSLPLREGATNLVFGEGDCNTEILFIGEGPGYWEDQKARPFVGNSGSLLNKLLQTIKLNREDVFITNVVFFRPPNNRDPLPEEINAFKPYIDGIIDTIDPKIIVTLGRFSMAKFIPNVFISSVHGKIFNIKWDDKDKVVIPMYHPAAALRNGNVMNMIKNDFLKIPEILNEVISNIIVDQMTLI
ncbi:uracil-DNA glycosylase [Patescibacteria group bacterium]|nr:uracil-DNA glycosylase [Patescibacteria group bacterium]MBU2036199.1 uracil-DNA glycosylase [Patescibacteria group bacterium]